MNKAAVKPQVETGAKPPRPDDQAETFKATVAEAVAEQEHLMQQEFRRRSKAMSATRFLLILTTAVFVGSCIYSYLEMKDISRPFDHGREQAVKAMDIHLRSIAARIGAYKAEHLKYPVSLSLVGVKPDKNLKFTLVSNQVYQIEYEIDGHRLLFDSRTVQPAVPAVPQAWAR